MKLEVQDDAAKTVQPVKAMCLPGYPVRTEDKLPVPPKNPFQLWKPECEEISEKIVAIESSRIFPVTSKMPLFPAFLLPRCSTKVFS